MFLCAFFENFPLTGNDSIGPAAPSQSSVATSSEGDASLTDMDVVPASAMIGGIVAASGPAQAGAAPGMMQGQMGGMMAGQVMMAAGMPGMQGAPVAPGAPPIGKKEKKKKEKKFIRLAASTTWEDPTLAEWAQGELFILL